MKIWDEYFLANSITAALEKLAANSNSVQIIAGGTDLLLDIEQGRHPPVHTLVDVTNIPELLSIEMRGEYLFVGAGTPLSRIVESKLVQEKAEALYEAVRLIGGPQVRNVATLGGNVAHALPAADGTIALLALDAYAEIASLDGSRKQPLHELFLGPGKSTLDPRKDLLVGFYIPDRQVGQASVHKRVMRPQGVAIAILNMSVWLWREQDKVKDVHIAVGPGGPIPTRAFETEKFLANKVIDEENIAEAHKVLLSETHFRTSRHRATSEYREHIAGVLLKETLQIAWERALNNPF